MLGHSLASSASLLQPRAICLGMVLPIVAWDAAGPPPLPRINQQNLFQTLAPSQSNLSNSSVKVLSCQVTVGCIEMTIKTR